MNPIQVNKIKIYPFKSKAELLDYLIDKHKILIATNAEKILKDDVKLQEIINNNIAYPDGIGAVMALKKKGYKVAKIPGVELWHDIIERYHKEKSFYFIGASQEVIEITISKLKKEFLEIDIKNYRNGFLKDGDIENIKADLLLKKPDVVFVAMGTPKQEFLMQEFIAVHPALYQGLGGSFDVYSGKLKRAPKIFLKLRVEFLYRLILEPKRIGRQLHLVKFLINLHLGRY
jgi:UDP-N-acetyl-D-mannosaminouronate:lipid I N-acetyl-D-mannosaminouronosyltransferase